MVFSQVFEISLVESRGASQWAILKRSVKEKLASEFCVKSYLPYDLYWKPPSFPCLHRRNTSRRPRLPFAERYQTSYAYLLLYIWLYIKWINKYMLFADERSGPYSEKTMTEVPKMLAFSSPGHWNAFLVRTERNFINLRIDELRVCQLLFS